MAKAVLLIIYGSSAFGKVNNLDQTEPLIPE